MANMITGLIPQLISLTQNNEIKWRKNDPNNPNAYCFDAHLKTGETTIEATFIIDKYDTKDSRNVYNCINFAILDSNLNIINELVRCEQTIPQYQSEYAALNTLYLSVIQNYQYFNRTIELPNNIGFQNV